MIHLQLSWIVTLTIIIILTLLTPLFILHPSNGRTCQRTTGRVLHWRDAHHHKVGSIWARRRWFYFWGNKSIWIWVIEENTLCCAWNNGHFSPKSAFSCVVSLRILWIQGHVGKHNWMILRLFCFPRCEFGKSYISCSIFEKNRNPKNESYEEVDIFQETITRMEVVMEKDHTHSLALYAWERIDCQDHCCKFCYFEIMIHLNGCVKEKMLTAKINMKKFQLQLNKEDLECCNKII